MSPSRLGSAVSMSDDFSSHDPPHRHRPFEPPRRPSTASSASCSSWTGAQLAEHAPPIDGVLHRSSARLRRRYDPSPLVARISAFFEGRVLQYVALRLREQPHASPPPPPPPPRTPSRRRRCRRGDHVRRAPPRLVPRLLPLRHRPPPIAAPRRLRRRRSRARGSTLPVVVGGSAAAAVDGGGDELIGDAAEELSWVSGLLQRHINSFARAGGFRAALRVVETPGSLSLPVRAAAAPAAAPAAARRRRRRRRRRRAHAVSTATSHATTTLSGATSPPLHSCAPASYYDLPYRRAFGAAAGAAALRCLDDAPPGVFADRDVTRPLLAKCLAASQALLADGVADPGAAVERCARRRPPLPPPIGLRTAIGRPRSDDRHARRRRRR